MDTFELESVFVQSLCTLTLLKFFWILHLWKYKFPLVLEILIDQSTVSHKPPCYKKPTSLILSVSVSLSLCTRKGPPNSWHRLPFPDTVFPYKVPKAGRGTECPQAPAGRGKAVLHQGTYHVLHPRQKGTWGFSSWGEIPVPEWDWKPNGKDFTS